MFKDAWEREVRILTDAVDDITTIHDFLAVSGELTFLSNQNSENLSVVFDSYFNLINDIKIFP